MAILLNFFYLLALLFLSPWVIFKICTTGKYRRGLLQKFLGLTPRLDQSPRVWFHGVSVGEVMLLRQLVPAFRNRFPHCLVVLSTTTDTGMEQLQKHFPDCTVFFFPLDFSWAVNRALKRVQPDLIVLAESELWPNFLHFASKKTIPVAIVNGRLSPRSLARYQKLSWLAGSLFQLPSLWAMQTEDYANNVRSLGARNVHATGSMKYDNVELSRDNPSTEQFRQLFQVEKNDVIWIAGSTQDPEEVIALSIYQKLKLLYPNLRLILVPRQRERFEEVARLLENKNIPYRRRSQLRGPCENREAVVLVDSIGELKAIWGLADIAFVGGSLDGKRGGQSMIEPAGYGVPLLFGPHVWNFRETAFHLLQNQAALEVKNEEDLFKAVKKLLEEDQLGQEIGGRALHFIQSQQGATQRALDLLAPLVPVLSRSHAA